MDSPLIVGLRDVQEIDGVDRAGLVGGKGAGLMFLAECIADDSAVIPDGFVVTTAAFETVIDADVGTRIEQLIGQADPDDFTALEAAAEGARDLVTGISLPGDVEEAIRLAYADLTDPTEGVPTSPSQAGSTPHTPTEGVPTSPSQAGSTPHTPTEGVPTSPSQAGSTPHTPVAVRSSAAGEDAAGASFAGEHDSYLWVTGADDVVQRVRDCWASAWTARAISYRAKGDLPVTPMAVVVQHMVPARSAGVLMTLNPLNGDRSKVVIESLWGLGEPLVSGTADPDRWVIDKITGDIAKKAVAHKPTQAVRDPDTGRGCTTQPVPDDRLDQPSLTREELHHLVAIGRAIEDRAGTPQDGEFAVTDDGQIHLLQARPETVWANRETKSVSQGQGALGSIVATLSRGSGWKH